MTFWGPLAQWVKSGVKGSLNRASARAAGCVLWQDTSSTSLNS